MNSVDLKSIRREKKMIGAKVAKQAGITQQYYNYIENGHRRPSVPVAKRIAAVLGFDWTRFYDESDSGGVSDGAAGESAAAGPET